MIKRTTKIECFKHFHLFESILGFFVLECTYFTRNFFRQSVGTSCMYKILKWTACKGFVPLEKHGEIYYFFIGNLNWNLKNTKAMSLAVDSTQWNICSGRHSNESENSRIIKKIKIMTKSCSDSLGLLGSSLVNYHSLVYIFKKWKKNPIFQFFRFLINCPRRRADITKFLTKPKTFCVGSNQPPLKDEAWSKCFIGVMLPIDFTYNLNAIYFVHWKFNTWHFQNSFENYA